MSNTPAVTSTEPVAASIDRMLSTARIWALLTTSLLSAAFIGATIQVVGTINTIMEGRPLQPTGIIVGIVTILCFIGVSVMQVAAKMDHAELLAKKYSNPK